RAGIDAVRGRVRAIRGDPDRGAQRGQYRDRLGRRCHAGRAARRDASARCGPGARQGCRARTVQHGLDGDLVVPDEPCTLASASARRFCRAVGPGARRHGMSAATDWRPAATLAALRQRAVMLAHMRDFFAARDVLEVETPVLSAAGVSDPQIESLVTRVEGMRAPLHLCPSPEFHMKRLLAAGSGDIYQLSRVFRDAERGRWHNPEFSLLEWYRLGFDDAALMAEVEEL